MTGKPPCDHANKACNGCHSVYKFEVMDGRKKVDDPEVLGDYELINKLAGIDSGGIR